MSHTIKDIDEVDDDLFISKKPQNYIFAEKKANDLNEKINKSMFNAKRIIYETQQVGQSTLENLSVQREGLERTENNLDVINTTTRGVQKNLNNMNSWGGLFKSIFSKSNKPSAVATTQPIVPSTTNSSMPRSKTLASVPSNIPAGSSSSSSSGTNNVSSRASFATTSSVQPGAVEDESEADLSEIGFALGGLKTMAEKLGNEIVEQNEMLDRITDKSERASDSIKHQNRQISQLLKKG